MTKTCPDCDATVLSTSQPNLRKAAETFAIEARALVKPNHPDGMTYAPVFTAKEFRTLLAALAATPAVGGEIEWEDIARQLFAVDGNGFWEDRTPLQEEAYTIRAKAVTALYAAQPASPLRGREYEALADTVEKHVAKLANTIMGPYPRKRLYFLHGGRYLTPQEQRLIEKSLLDSGTTITTLSPDDGGKP